MVKKDSINQVQQAEIETIFEQIAALSAQCDELFFHFSDPTGESKEALGARDNAMRSLIGSIGLLAEVGYRSIAGAGGMKERIEDWVLPPSYQWPREREHTA